VPEGTQKHCLFVLDVPEGPILCPLALPADATVSAALMQARQQLQDRSIEVAIDWEGATIGVWGVRCERHSVPRDGDRIEVYRPLATDPRDRRRLKARATRRS
jgi:hypothetical protein